MILNGVRTYDEISFSPDIVGGGDVTAVRVSKQPVDGCRRVSARDIIAVVCEKDVNAAGLVWRRLRKSDKMAELAPYMCEFSFESGRGSRPQPALSLQGCFKLLMVLPGEHAKRFRSASARIMLAFFAGDTRCTAEVQASAECKDLLHELAREELRCEEERPRKMHKKTPFLCVMDDNASTDGQELALVRFENEFDALYTRWAREEEEAIAAAAGGRVHGHCYVAWNPLFSSLCKIGATTRAPEVRVRELSRTSVPEPFQLIASFPCWEPFQVEKRIHTHFAAARKYGRRNEFFELERDVLIQYFALLANEVGARGPMRASAKPSLHKEVVKLRAQVAQQAAEILLLRQLLAGRTYAPT